jgi:predicted alternative tryptophan synthase beta-subunit
MILYPDDTGSLHIFHLTGTGLWGNVSKIAKALGDISRLVGLNSVSLSVKDKRRLRLFKQCGAKVVYDDGVWTTLELENNV